MYETGAMRRTHLRHHDNIIKRLLIHAGAFNLGLAMRKMTGYGTPRGLQSRINLFVSTLPLLCAALEYLALPAPPPRVTLWREVTPFHIAVRASAVRCLHIPENRFSHRLLALYFAHYNFCRIHSSIRVTPAMEAKITDHVWEIDELIAA